MSKETAQAKMLRDARAKLGITSAELAAQLGVEVGTLRQWLLPKGAKAHRLMGRTAILLLDRIVADKPKKRRK